MNVLEQLLANPVQLNELILVLAVGLVLGLESFWPMHASSSQTLWRWVNNLLLAGLTYALVSRSLNALTAWPALHLGSGLGLLPRVGAGFWAEFAAVLLCLELLNYGLHRASHAVPLLWRLHAVHHSDTEFDVTTAHRHHPLEGLLTGILMLPALWVLSPSMEALLAYAALRAMTEALSHANLTWGSRTNRLLKWVLVTPDFHRVHHCAHLPYTDRNFSSMLPVFDHLFGTAAEALNTPSQALPIGLDYFRESREVRLDQMLLQPLRDAFSTRR